MALSLTHSLTEDFYFWHSKSDPIDLWPLRHLIRLIKKHNLTNIFNLFEIFEILTILTFFENQLIVDNLKSLTDFDNFLQCWYLLTLLTMLTILFDKYVFFYNLNNLFTILTEKNIILKKKITTLTIAKTCDIWWDTDYNSDNWEPEFFTIFVT